MVDTSETGLRRPCEPSYDHIGHIRVVRRADHRTPHPAAPVSSQQRFCSCSCGREFHSWGAAVGSAFRVRSVLSVWLGVWGEEPLYVREARIGEQPLSAFPARAFATRDVQGLSSHGIALSTSRLQRPMERHRSLPASVESTDTASINSTRQSPWAWTCRRSITSKLGG